MVKLNPIMVNQTQARLAKHQTLLAKLNVKWKNQTKFKHSFPKGSMVHYNVSYISMQPNMWQINDVKFNINQELRRIMVCIKGYV